MTTTTEPLLADSTSDTEFPCITQDPTETPPPEALAVCTKKGEILSASTVSGGHAYWVCRPCYEVSKRMGYAL